MTPQNRSHTDLQHPSSTTHPYPNPPPPQRHPASARATKSPGKAQQAFQRGLAALAQWVEREGADRPVPRGHTEQLAIDSEEPVTIKLGVWISNTKSRRDRLDADQLDALAKLGMEWAKLATIPQAAPDSL